MTSIAKCPTHGFWKKSATLLLVGPGKYGRPTVLTVKRSSKATFMPNSVVFPGGICETADFSMSWCNVFPEFAKFTVNPEASYPDIFVNDSKSKKLEELSPHVGFRIAAIRELLEETGLLIDQKHGIRVVSDAIREKIQQHPDQFCDIVKGMHAVPDIWALHDWSTWLTPVGLVHSSRRYDTHFYVVIVDSIDGVTPSSDRSEVSTVQFWDVDDLLDASAAGKVQVPPPQMYELGRLLNFNSLDELRDYARTRDRLGTERLYPVHINCLDGFIRVLPGDSLYPEVPDLIGKDPVFGIDKTLDECMKLYPKHHRLVRRKGKPVTLEINISLNLQQKIPLGQGRKSLL